MPSRLMSKKTRPVASPSESADISPTPDSSARRIRIPACTKAGSGRRRAGSGGMPREIDDREMNTVDW